jgi:hypothetical protein
VPFFNFGIPAPSSTLFPSELMLTPNPRIDNTNELFLFYLNKETAPHNDVRMLGTSFNNFKLTNLFDFC